MLRFFAASFSVAFSCLERAEYTIALSALTENDEDGPSSPARVAEIRTCLKEFSEACDELPISASLKGQIARVQGRVHMANDHERHVLTALVQELKHNIIEELSGHWFLMVHQDRRWLHEQSGPVFGQAVAGRFSDANTDIASAGRCFALDEWTGCVFHLMRVLEHGLRDLANRVGATFSSGIELENWKNIIDVIEKEIRLKEQQTKGAQKSADLEFYSKAASQFWYFKEAWRNHVAHSRATYGEREATQVFNAVRDLMQHLTTRP